MISLRPTAPYLRLIRYLLPLFFLAMAGPAAASIDVFKHGVVHVTATGGENSRYGAGVVVYQHLDTVTILTASHILEDTEHVSVSFYGDTTKHSLATVVAEEVGDDGLALLSVEIENPSSLPLRLAPSGDLETGDSVHLIGFPQSAGIPWATTLGRLSGFAEKMVIQGAADTGNSGGPVLFEGRFVGLLTREQSPFAFAVPAEKIESFLTQNGVNAPTLLGDRAFTRAKQLYRMGQISEALEQLEIGAKENDDRSMAALSFMLLRTAEEDTFFEQGNLAPRRARAWAQESSERAHPLGLLVRRMLRMMILEEGKDPDLIAQVFKDWGQENLLTKLVTEAGHTQLKPFLEEGGFSYDFLATLEEEMMLVLELHRAPFSWLNTMPDTAPSWSVEMDGEDFFESLMPLFFEENPLRLAGLLTFLVARAQYEDGSFESLEDHRRVARLLELSRRAGLQQAFALSCEVLGDINTSLPSRGGLLRSCEEFAETGDEDAAETLGDIYLTGQGVQRDFRVARFWYSKGVEAGYVELENSLGHIEELGLVSGHEDLGAACSRYERVYEARSWDWRPVFACRLLGIGKPDSVGARASVLFFLQNVERGWTTSKFWMDEIFPPPATSSPPTDSPPPTDPHGRRLRRRFEDTPHIAASSLEVEANWAKVDITHQERWSCRQLRYRINLSTDRITEFAELMFKTALSLDGKWGPIPSAIWLRRAERLGYPVEASKLEALGLPLGTRDYWTYARTESRQRGKNIAAVPGADRIEIISEREGSCRTQARGATGIVTRPF